MLAARSRAGGPPLRLGLLPLAPPPPASSPLPVACASPRSRAGELCRCGAGGGASKRCSRLERRAWGLLAHSALRGVICKQPVMVSCDGPLQWPRAHKEEHPERGPGIPVGNQNTVEPE